MKQAFTLIELLVVVLIIGILAAVALPQYQVGVEKSRVSTLLPMLKAIAQAQEVYYLANNKYASSIEELDVDIPDRTKVAEDENISTTYKTSQNFIIGVAKGYLVGNTGKVQIDFYLAHHNLGGQNACYARADSTIAQRVCKSFGVNPMADDTCAYLVPGASTPCKGGFFSF